MNRQSQSGIALITAILVVAIAAIASAAMLGSANIAIRRTANLQDSEIAWWYATGVEQWVLTLLAQDADDNKYDAYSDVWAQPIDYLPIDNGAMRGRIVDLQGCLNLNNFATTSEAEFETLSQLMTRLFDAVGADNPSRGGAIAAAIRDWIDGDVEPTGYDGAEDTEYLGYEIPYRVPNRLMSDPSEILAVKGMDKNLFRQLRDYLCALPLVGTKINVNTAPPQLLASITEGGQRAALNDFVQSRLDQPAERMSDLYDAGVFTSQDPGVEWLGVETAFFQSQVEVVVGSGHLTLYSSYLRPPGKNAVVYGRSTDTR